MKLKKEQYEVLCNNFATKDYWENKRIKIKLLEDIIVYKKLQKEYNTFDCQQRYICTMIIPKGSEIVCNSDFTGKSRTNEVGILSIGEYQSERHIDADFIEKVRHSRYDNCYRFITYKVGESLKAPLGKTLDTCASGIHFYFTVEEAMNH